jgi:hypothetical protein
VVISPEATGTIDSAHGAWRVRHLSCRDGHGCCGAHRPVVCGVSVRDDTIFGPNAIPGGEGLAITVLTGLVNSFVVSLLGLIPKTNIGEPAAIMAVIGIVAIIRLQRRLHAGRNLIVLAITLLAHAAQLGFGVLLLVHPHDSDQLINPSFIVFVTLIVSLQRAWSLLKGKWKESAAPSPRP